jgi:hypothetical protein
MSKLDLAIVLAVTAALTGCASGPIAESGAPQNPPVRTETRTTDPVTGRTTTTTTTTPPATATDTRRQDVRDSRTHGDYETDLRIRREHPWEVTLGGTGTNDENFDVGAGQLTGSVGYYFSEWTELSLRHSVSYSDDLAAPPGISPEDVWAFQTRLAFDLHFPMPVVTPYVGALVGYVYGDTPVDDTFAIGPEAGIKIYVQHDAFIQVGAEWVFFTDRESTIDDTFEDGQIFYFAGIGLRF